MRLNANVITNLIGEAALSQNQMAKQIGISKGYLSNSLSGRRGAGRKLLSGLLKQFPNETVASLTEQRQVAI